MVIFIQSYIFFIVFCRKPNNKLKYLNEFMQDELFLMEAVLKRAIPKSPPGLSERWPERLRGPRPINMQ